MDEKLIELENALIMQYPARLQKGKIDKKQFREYPAYNTVDFDIKTVSGKIITFRVTLDGKLYNISCTFSNKQTKKIKDIIKLIDYVIDNA